MTKFSFKNKNEVLRRLIAATLITAALHVSGFLLVARPLSSPSAKKSGRSVSFVSCDRFQSASLLPFIKNNNPLLFVRPDFKFGFSSSINRKTERTPLPDIAISSDLSQTASEKKQMDDFILLKKVKSDFGDKTIFAYQNIAIQRPKDNSRPDIIAKREYPLVFDSYGKNLRDLSEKLKTLPIPQSTSETICEFTFKGFDRIPSVKILKSSSDSTLDRTAQNAIIPYASKIAAKWDLDRICLTIYWKEDGKK
jgi:hypothetical protein